MNIEKLIQSLPDSYTQIDYDLINRAFKVARNAHKKQKRASGEPYINHPIAVALILSDLKVPSEVIAAGLLHDTVEDTNLKSDDIKRDFGEVVASLVDGVTKLSQLPRVSRSDKLIDDRDGKDDRGDLKYQKRDRSRGADLASENLRKIFLAMGEDVRIVLIKLADRLHNIRTLGHVPEHKRERIARQTLDIFAPLANRLGIWQIKWELEDLSFRYTDPDTYKDIAKNLAERRSEREKQVQEIVNKLISILNQNDIESQVSGRPKHIYSIYRKMLSKGLTFDSVRDVRAVRIIVEDIPACYSSLGLIHTHWRPLPGEFDDYIAAPKDNFYQSLHTAVIFDDGKPLEVQIRTQEMHDSAEYGIAAHWRYKEGAARDQNFEKRVVWFRQMMDWISDVEDATEFVDSMKTDVFSDRVYAFTPAGDIIDLPAGSTPLDFAYHVHTEVGDRCRGAKVNGKLISLDTVLKTGDQVEILTAKRGGPSRDWLNPNLKLVNTNRARTKVRQWFRRQDREENVSMGKTQLEREFRRLSLTEINLSNLAKEYNFKTVDDLYLAIGIGDLAIGRVVNQLALGEDEIQDDYVNLKNGNEEAVRFGDESMAVLGLKGVLTTLAKCCKPVPGDDIVGYITRGRGATIHRQDCPNVLRINDRERLAKVSWGEPRSTYPVSILISAYDRDGLMKDVSTIISEEGINMSSVNVSVNKSNQAIFDIILEVGNINQLSKVLTMLENLPNVMEARRVNPG